jgi:6-phosphogluconolactonase
MKPTGSSNNCQVELVPAELLRKASLSIFHSSSKETSLKRNSQVFLIFFALFASLSYGKTNPSGSSFVYVALDSARSLVILQADNGSGQLRFLKTIPLGGSGGALVVDQTHRFLYAALRSENSLAVFAIDKKTGDLERKQTFKAAGNPAYMSFDQSGKFLLTAYFADSKASVHRVRPDGWVDTAAVQILNTALNAHAIQTDPTNRFLFIPCRTGETIHQFVFDAEKGMVSPNSPEKVLTDSLTGPRHFVFHPHLAMAYVVNEFSSTITAYRFDTSKGTLAPFQSIFILPKEFKGHSKAADIHITPNGKFLYASNRGDNSIAALFVDSVSGRLSTIGFYATEKTPRSFDIDPSGRFLYAGGQGSDKLTVYRIEQRTGILIAIGTYVVGEHPAWVNVVGVEQR